MSFDVRPTEYPGTTTINPTLPMLTELESPVRRIACEEIDVWDMQFQCRLKTDPSDILESLRVDSQQVPVLLWGTSPHYKIVDGFRRVAGLLKLGESYVTAIVRADLTDAEVFALGFTHNVRRRSLTPLDKASAIWKAIHHRKVPRRVVMKTFGLSERQISRYLSLLELPMPVKAAVIREEISMAHAAVINRSDVKNPRLVIQQVVDQGLAADDLSKILAPKRRGRPKQYVVRDGNGFRMTSFRFSPHMPDPEKAKLSEALERALTIVRKSMS